MNELKLAYAAPRVLAAACFLGGFAFVWPFTVDDAFVYARFADNLIHGAGYRFSPGGALDDGLTAPPWVLAHVFGLAGAKALGALAALIAWGRVVAASRGGGGLWATLFLLVQANLHAWSVAGLETGLALLVFTELGLRSRRAHESVSSAVFAGGLAGALAWLRPELTPGALVFVGVLAFRSGRVGKIALGVAGAVALGVVGFRLALFGHAFPLAVDAKPGDVATGASYVLRGLLVTGLGVALLTAWLRRRELPIVAALVLTLLALPLAGGDWMPGFRLLVPLLPLGGFVFGASVVSDRGREPLLVAVALLALAIPSADLVAQVPRYHDSSRARETVGAEIVEALRTHGGPVAMVDIGYFGWASGVAVVDLGGVTDADVASLPGGHLAKRVRAEWLRERGPRAILLHAFAEPEVSPDARLVGLAGFPVERRVAGFPWVRERFRVARVLRYQEASLGEPAIWYVLLTRRE